MTMEIERALDIVSEGYSSDRVVADPEINRRFIEQCRGHGLDEPVAQGVYHFFCQQELLYVGETENIRKRITKHLEHSDNKGLAHWIWERGTDNLHLEIHVLQNDTPTRVRKALELELIRSRYPVFNVKR